mgnify:CR=1 FL=1
MATAFMGEPTQTYNMLYRAMYDLNQNPKSKEARKKAGKVLMVYVQTAVATAMAAAVVDALRDKEKEPYQERYVKRGLRKTFSDKPEIHLKYDFPLSQGRGKYLPDTR